MSIEIKNSFLSDSVRGKISSPQEEHSFTFENME